MADRSHAAEVIADRYLTSPSRLAARPYGPIDALDTHSGRAAQVRIVFVSGRWQEPELADAVARWCAIGTSGVCGVLDFGRHADRWFLVLPPSLGTPVERWRSMRRPSAVDAAALALAFGRLLEAVGAAGFDAGSAVVSDFAVGPGPTPFLEQPLLTSPAAAASINRRSGGQSVLAALFAAAAPDGELPSQLAAWRQAADDAAHPSLGVCLDALERAAAACRTAGPEPPVGLAGVFDGPYTPPAAPPWATWARRIAGPLAIALAMAGAAGALLLGRQPHRSAAPPPPARAHPAATPRPVHRSPSPLPSTAGSRGPKHHAATHPARRVAHRRHTPAAAQRTAAVAASSSTAARPPARSTATPPRPPARSTATPPATITLPAPGGTVLPAP